jgi:hypothetical protein
MGDDFLLTPSRKVRMTGIAEGLLVATILGALGTVASWLAPLSVNTKVELSAAALIVVLILATSWVTRRDIGRLRSSLGVGLEWTYNAEEHRREVYRRIAQVLEDPRVKRFDILSIFSPVQERIDDTTHLALKHYYHCLERALRERPNFIYRRAVVLRSPLAHESGAKGREVTDLLSGVQSERGEFVDHYWRVRDLSKRPGNYADIRFFRDDGRLLDMGFALAKNEGGHALSLLLDIAIASVSEGGGAVRRALALLSIHNPSHDQQRALDGVVDAIFDGRVVPRIGDELVAQCWARHRPTVAES